MRTPIAVALLALLLAAPAPAATPTPDLSQMFVVSGGKTVGATLGAYCHPTGCPDPRTFSYPLKGTGSITARAGSTITLLFKAPVRDLDFRAARIDGRGQEVLTTTGGGKHVTKTRRRWRITLPRTLSRTTDLLGFDVVYSNTAYSSFEVGLKVLRPAPRR
jgi:hypothetical protein